MLLNDNIWSLAEAYTSGTLSVEEQHALQVQLATNHAFAAEFNECIDLLSSLNGSGEQKRFRTMLKDIQHTTEKVQKETVSRSIPLRTHYLRTAGIAAGIALLTSLTTFWAIQYNNKKITSQYRLLRKDLETYKRSHNQLVNNFNQKTNTPVAEVRYTGTGFALTNDGYLVTNYHVTEGADSVYIQNSKGEYFKTKLVSFDQKSDVALLKVEDPSFRFGKGEIPYALTSSKRKLGAKVFTLGFPQDEIVYNQGYISAKNGFNGDTFQYRLQVPANFGQSGAPVFDQNGELIAVITGKEGESEGTTYAVSTKAIVELVQAMPKENRIKLPKVNRVGKLSREEQIEKLEQYTCTIKVYKK